jgi:hypothetical protein
MFPAIKVYVPRKKAKRKLPAPMRPRLDSGMEAELLSGNINGMKASAGEERFAKALRKIAAVDGFEFRYTTMPRGLPGYKELDFLVQARNMVYAIEVDTAFTHRDKGRADVLHDAIILAHLEQKGYQVFATVIHLDGESDLVNQQNADRTAKGYFL